MFHNSCHMVFRNESYSIEELCFAALNFKATASTLFVSGFFKSKSIYWCIGAFSTLTQNAKKRSESL